MKFRFILYCLFFSVCKTVSAQNAVVALDFHQVLFVGLENPISIAIEGVNSKDILVNITGIGNYIYKVAEGKYTAKVIPQKDSNICFINVSVQSKGKVKLLTNKSYRIELIPKGEAMFGEYRTGGIANVSELIKQKKLIYSNDLCVQGLLNYKIEKFQFLILPKNGSIEQIEFRGDQLNEMAISKLLNLKQNDIIILDRIRAGNGHTSEALNPIVLYISNPQIKTLRIEGQTFHGDTIKPYWYPENANQDYNDAPLESEKHGVWKTYLYSDKRQDYYLSQKDSFHFGKHIYTSVFNENQLLYKIDYNNNAQIHYTQYYLNGEVYQIGEVAKKQDHEIINYSKFYNLIDTNIVLKSNPFENYCKEINPQYYCIGEWTVYHMNGKIKAELNYKTLEDSLRKSLYLESGDPEKPLMEPMKYLLILLDGNCVFYNENGKLEKRLQFKNGKIISN